MTKIIIVMIGLMILQIVRTKLTYSEETVSSIFRIARRYLYYSIFLPGFIILADKARLKRFLGIFIFSIVVLTFLYIFQYVVGSNQKIFLAAKIQTQYIQGYQVTRQYVSGTLWVSLVFGITFFIIMFDKLRPNSLVAITLLILTLAQTLLTFGRAHILGVFMGLLFSLVLAKEAHKLRKSFGAVFVIAIAIFIVSIISAVTFPEKENIMTPIFKRVSSTYDAIINRKDSFGFRIKDSMGRIELLRQHPLIGVGFVHDESKLFSVARGSNKEIRTTDSGLLTLLIDFGVIGFIWLTILSFFVLKRALSIYKGESDQQCRCIILGILAFYFGRLFSFITLADFVTYEGIVSISLALLFLEVISFRRDPQYGSIYNSR